MVSGLLDEDDEEEGWGVVVDVVVLMVVVVVVVATLNLGFSSVMRISSGLVISLILMPSGLSLPTAEGGTEELLALLTGAASVVDEEMVVDDTSLAWSSSVLSEELLSLWSAFRMSACERERES